jgi:hypothetical protein
VAAEAVYDAEFRTSEREKAIQKDFPDSGQAFLVNPLRRPLKPLAAKAQSVLDLREDSQERSSQWRLAGAILERGRQPARIPAC